MVTRRMVCVGGVLVDVTRGSVRLCGWFAKEVALPRWC